MIAHQICFDIGKINNTKDYVVDLQFEGHVLKLPVFVLCFILLPHFLDSFPVICPKCEVKHSLPLREPLISLLKLLHLK